MKKHTLLIILKTGLAAALLMCVLVTGLMLFTALLVAGLIYLDRVTGFVSRLIGILSPFLVGGALAFIAMQFDAMVFMAPC